MIVRDNSTKDLLNLRKGYMPPLDLYACVPHMLRHFVSDPQKWMNKQLLILQATELTVTMEIPWDRVKEAVQMYKDSDLVES